MKIGRCLILAILLLAGVQEISAQKIRKLGRKIDSVLTVRYQRANIDTNYIIRPQTKWTVMGRLNVSGARIHALGSESGHYFESKLKADYKTTFSIGVSYLGLSLNLALNPAKLLGKYHDFELNLKSYGRRFGFDIAYQDAHNFKGWYEEDGVRQEFSTTGEMFKLRTLNVNAYYAFNHRRFSYSAAFAHSYIQRRSAGSFLIALSGQGQHGKVDIEGESMDFKMTNIGIGAGYGYNFVPAQGWLLHISALPTLSVYSNTSITLDETKNPLHYHFPEIIVTARGAIVKQIGRNKFAGLSMVYHYTTIGHKDTLNVRNSKWLARLYFGFRF